MCSYQNVLSIIILKGLITQKGVSLPDITFSAVELTIQSQHGYHLICATDYQFYGCTVEFLLNGRTFDDMRFADNTCYNKDGQCLPYVCSCSDTCKQFEWNLTSISHLGNKTFGCSARIVENQLVFKANISLMFTFGVITSTQKNVAVISGNVPDNDISTPTESKILTTTRPGDPESLLVLTFAGTMFTAIMLIVVIICCLVLYNKKSKSNCSQDIKTKTADTNVYTVPTENIEKSNDSMEINPKSCDHKLMPGKQVQNSTNSYDDKSNRTCRSLSSASLSGSQSFPGRIKELDHLPSKKKSLAEHVIKTYTENLKNSSSDHHQVFRDKDTSTTSFSSFQKFPGTLTGSYERPTQKTHIHRTSSEKYKRKTNADQRFVPFYDENTDHINLKLPELRTNQDNNQSKRLCMIPENLSSQLNSRGRWDTISSVSTGVSSHEALITSSGFNSN